MFEIEIVDESTGHNHRIQVSSLPRKDDMIVLKNRAGKDVHYEVTHVVFEEGLLAGLWEAYVHVVLA